MKISVVVPLVVVFVTMATGQVDFNKGRGNPKQAINPRPISNQRSPINPRPLIQPNPVDTKPVATNPYDSSPFAATTLPPDIEAILGGSIMGGAIPGGLFNDLPTHGGSGSDPDANYDAGAWSDPWNGTAFPVDFRGDFNALVYDNVNNVYYRPDQQISEQRFMRVRNYETAEKVSFDPATFQHQQNNVGQSNFGGPSDSFNGNNIPGQQVHATNVQSTLTSKSSRVITAGRPSYLNERPLFTDLSGQARPSVTGHNMGTGSDGYVGDKTSSQNIINPAGHVVADLSVNAASHNVRTMSKTVSVGQNVHASTGGSQLGQPNGFYDESQHGLANSADVVDLSSGSGGHGSSVISPAAMATGQNMPGQGVYEGESNMGVGPNYIPMQPMNAMGPMGNNNFGGSMQPQWNRVGMDNGFGPMQNQRDQMGMNNNFDPRQSQPFMPVIPNPVPRRVQQYPPGYRRW